MAARFLTAEDFSTGEFAISTDTYTEDRLNDYIERHEKLILIDLFGAELYKAFIADWDGGTAGQLADPKFLAVYNEILIDEDDCHLLHSEGIKVMLKCIIYFLALRDSNFVSTIGGTKENEQANAISADYNQTNMLTLYNRGVKYYNVMQYYMECYNPENYDYSAFNGRIKHYSSVL